MIDLVVKLGGEAIAGPGLQALAHDLAKLSRNKRALVVHGGGAQTTQLQQALGQSPRKIAGRRVTDEATLRALQMAVGKLNMDVCAALLAAGGRPVGMAGPSSCVIEAVRRPPRVISGGGPEPVDLGLVGDVTAVNDELLGGLLDAGYLPVLACVGADRAGGLYNINGDVVANRVAVELRARALVLVTSVPGVLIDVADPTSRIRSMNRAQCRQAIADGSVSGGMIPKLEESFEAIAAGVGRIHIVGQLASGELERELSHPGSMGTVLTSSE